MGIPMSIRYYKSTICRLLSKKYNLSLLKYKLQRCHTLLLEKTSSYTAQICSIFHFGFFTTQRIKSWLKISPSLSQSTCRFASRLYDHTYRSKLENSTNSREGKKQSKQYFNWISRVSQSTSHRPQPITTWTVHAGEI